MTASRASRAGAFSGRAFLLCAIACSAREKPAQAPEAERTVLVAQPCPGLELGSEPIDAARARVFVEIAEASTRDLPQPIGDWLSANPVEVRSTANLVAFPNVPTSMPWGQCVDAVCSAVERSITLTARLPERASEPMELALRIEEPEGEGPDLERKVLLDASLQAMNQEPIVLPVAPDVSAGALIVTAYLLRRHDDLHRVLECKVRQSER